MNHQTHGSSMKWMLLGCGVVLLLLFVASDVIPSGFFLPILLGVCLLSHIWMMRRSHGSQTSEDKSAQHVEKKKTDGGHSGGGCCH